MRVTHFQRIELDVAHRPRCSGCWTDGPWFHGPEDYGVVWLPNPGRWSKAHIISLMLASGEEANGRLSCHACDVPRCYNPSHLWWGTNLENRQDSVRKGRAASGLRCGRSKRKLEEEQVVSIWDRYHQGGVTTYQLAEEFGVSSVAIQKILRRENWKWLRLGEST